MLSKEFASENKDLSPEFPLKYAFISIMILYSILFKDKIVD